MKTQHPVRVRFAPSPTGFLHIGGLRTALFNLLFARHYGGAFLVRVEDTDLERSRPEYTAAQLAALDWCGIRADEPLIFQSQRTDIYRTIAEKLVEFGIAYRCSCTQDDMRRRTQQYTDAEGSSYYFYDGFCRTRTIADDTPHVIRLITVREAGEVCSFNDLIHGPIIIPTHTIDDFIIIRSNGMPMYNFAVVVDDWQMGITHIIRGDDHIINTPRQIMIYKALDYLPRAHIPDNFPPLHRPYFAHIPLIVGADGKKLSKRDASTATDDYRVQGILPEALTNYLVRLGWSYGDCEIIARDALIKIFSLDNVGKKAATFDMEKLLWVNSVYIKEANPQTLADSITQTIEPTWRQQINHWSDKQLLQAIALYQKRVRTVRELYTSIIACAQQPIVAAHDRELRPAQQAALQAVARKLMQLQPYNHDMIKACIAQQVAVHALSMAELAMPIRIALTGSSSAPAVVDLLLLFGPDESARRITALL